MNKALLEIGFEEIPADYLKPAVNNIKENTAKILTEKRIGYENINVFYTVRRFVLVIEGIADRQEDLSFEKKGPKHDIAYKDGELTEVGKNFFEKNNIMEKDVEIKEEKGKKFLFLKGFEKGQDTKSVLKEVFPKIISGIKTPKSMVWEKNLVTFARPLRNLTAFFNNDIIEFNYGSVVSSNRIRLHKFIDENKEVKVKNPEDYFKVLEKNNIEISQEKRKSEIVEKTNKMLESKELRILEDKELLEKLASSVEQITINIGEFDKKYLFLPKEVIVTAMREHQRYFAVVTKSGEFTNYFVNVRDGGTKNNDEIVRQHSKVLFARLNDAEFFYNEDLKIPLEKNLEKLKEAIFITGLGSMYEKVERLVNLGKISKELFGYPEPSIIEKAARLAKADLVTDMISEKEFGSLRGFMGGIYLEKQGEDKRVCDAVAEHYYPNSVGDTLPESDEGLVVSLIDKMDNICGFFLAGFKPTGSKDPYAVRRQAMNIIYIVLEKNLDININKFISETSKVYKEQLGKELDEAELVDFFRQREINYFKDKGIDYDIVNAVVSGNNFNILDDFKKAEVLQAARKKENFDDIIFSFSRVNNIIPKGFEPGSVDQNLFDESEKTFYKLFSDVKPDILKSIENKGFSEAFSKMSSLKGAIDKYFDDVMVMDKDESKKNNKLNMLGEVNDVFTKLAKFSEIVIDRK